MSPMQWCVLFAIGVIAFLLLALVSAMDRGGE